MNVMKVRIQSSQFSDYAKYKLGTSYKSKASPYENLARALELEGIQRPFTMGFKRFVLANTEALIGFAAKVPQAFKKDQIARRSARRAQVKKTLSNNELSALWQEVGGVNPASDKFLETFEWRRARMKALKRYGARCQCCGASPMTGAVMNVDHIKPRKLFPHLALSLDNLQVLCHDCNHGKGNWDMTDWRQEAETLELRDVQLKVF
jgi:hypothetical protein